jgi:hypothetical protein
MMTADSPTPPPPPRTPAPAPTDGPWIETREGGLFFVNSLFLFPYFMVLVPLLTRIVVRATGGMPEESVIVDTFPLLAEYLLPRMGWLAVFPAWLAWKNLGIEHRTLPRVALGFLLATHVVVILWAVGSWFGWHGGTLPGGPGS